MQVVSQIYTKGKDHDIFNLFWSHGALLVTSILVISVAVIWPHV